MALSRDEHYPDIKIPAFSQTKAGAVVLLAQILAFTLLSNGLV
jgi:hypothetical protein